MNKPKGTTDPIVIAFDNDLLDHGLTEAQISKGRARADGFCCSMVVDGKMTHFFYAKPMRTANIFGAKRTYPDSDV